MNRGTAGPRHQLPCRPPVSIEAQVYAIQNELGISTTGTVTYLVKLGIELHTIRAAENARVRARLADAEFWKEALPFLGQMSRGASGKK